MEQVRCPEPTCGALCDVEGAEPGQTLCCWSCGQPFAVPPRATPSAFALSDPDTIPVVLGRFQVRRELGRGGFGVVYRAFDPQLQREVALKVAHPGSLADPNRQERFRREARTAAQLRHPHIVALFDAGEENGQHYLATTFIDGQTLASTIQAGRLDQRRAAQVVRELAEALAYAHRLGVVHRDVKPDNVMLDARGHAYLMDFGLAHRDEGGQQLTHHGTVLGTVLYMAPEQAADPAHPRPASDQYALGVVLYELLTGQTPFSGPPAVVLYHARQSPVLPPRSLDPSIPLDLETVCLKAMARQPEDRYGDCQALADDLRRWLEGEPIAARRLSLKEKVSRWFQREPAVVLALLGAALALLLAVGTSVTGAVVLARAAGLEENERLLAEQSEANARARKAQAEREGRLSDEAADALRAKQEEAERETRRAREAETTALREADDAREATRTLEARQRARIRYRYVADVNLAHQSLLDGDRKAVLELLGRYEPGQRHEDLRGFEWHLLRGLATGPDPLRWEPQGRGEIIAMSRGEGKPAATAMVHFAPTRPGANRGRVTLVRRDLEGEGRWVRESSEETTPPDPWEPAPRVVVSPTGSRMLELRGKGRSAVLWRPRSGTAEHIENVDENGNACFLSGAARLVTVHTGGRVRLWDVTASLRELQSWDVPGVRLVTGSAQVLFTASEKDGQWTLQAWGPLDRAPAVMATWPVDGPIKALAYAPASKLLASLEEAEVKLWTLEGEKPRALLKVPGCDGLQFSPDGALLLTRHKTGKDERLNVRAWRALTGKELTLQGSTNHQIRLAAFRASGHLLAAVGAADELLLWDIRDGRRLAIPGTVATEGVSAVAFVDDAWMLVARKGGAIDWHPLAGLVGGYSLDGNPGPLAGCYFTSEGKQAVVARGAVAHVAEAANRVPRRLDLSPGMALPGTWGQPGRYLPRRHADGKVDLLEVNQTLPTKVLTSSGNQLTALGTSTNGKRAAGIEPKRVRLWDVEAGKELPAVPLEGVTALALSHDGGRLAVACADRTIQVWDVATGKRERELKGHRGRVRGLTFSADGALLASAGEDRLVKLWETASGKEAHTLVGHEAEASCVAFGPNARTLASGGADRTVRLWNVATGEELLTLTGHKAEVTTICCSPTEPKLVSADADGVIRFWGPR